MNKKTIITLSVAAMLLIAFIVWIVWGNVAVTVSEYRVESERLPSAFNGFRIAQVSDLHNDELGEGNERLLKKLENADPDIIVITGDIVDRSRTDLDVALDFARDACHIAPAYYVSGNHESSLSEEDFAEFCEQLASLGVTVLENDFVAIERNGEYVSLVGISDQSFGYIPSNDELVALRGEKNDFTILLAHRPGDFGQYASCGYDLVFSGHLHGGQFRLPFLGGLYAPSYGLFPEYDGGVYERDESTMIVSRGVGNSSFPVRFNNPREIVLVELVAK